MQPAQRRVIEHYKSTLSRTSQPQNNVNDSVGEFSDIDLRGPNLTKEE